MLDSSKCSTWKYTVKSNTRSSDGRLTHHQWVTQLGTQLATSCRKLSTKGKLLETGYSPAFSSPNLPVTHDVLLWRSYAAVPTCCGPRKGSRGWHCYRSRLLCLRHILAKEMSCSDAAISAVMLQQSKQKAKRVGHSHSPTAAQRKQSEASGVIFCRLRPALRPRIPFENRRAARHE